MSENTQDECILTIEQIKDKVAKGKIELPAIQRGFVWKPYQIENLWDSLLRGFPIGCFICKKNSDGVIEILDGQQRLTSILLGLNWDDVEENTYVSHIKEIQKELKIFLDQEEYKNENDPRQYNTRVITKSHPWGYRCYPNKEILTYDDIKHAKIDIYNGINDTKDKERIKKIEKIEGNNTTLIDVYTDEKGLDVFFKYGFPYDSSSRKHCIEISHIISNDEYKKYNDALGKIMIPFVFINNMDMVVDTNKDLDSTEYLFTLINRGGTRVSNDDLNYSLIKNQLMKNNRKLINEINDNCKDTGISPSRFVMICYLLWREENKKEPDKTISLYIKPTQFRNSMKDRNNQDDFRKFLEKHKHAEWITEAKELIVYADEDKKQKGIPYIWFLDILQQSMPLTFLICYLMKKNIKKNIIPFITILAVFGYHKYQQQTLRKLVESFVKEVKNDEDMEDKTLQKFFQNHEDLMTKPLDPKEIKQKCKDEEFYKHNNENDYSNNFGYYIKWKNELLLYAQRKFLAEQFGEKMFTLDDMNCPFDYDHIFPAKYRQWNKCQNWDTIGNFRAWPYNLNRGDGEKLPCKKFKKKDDKEKELEEYDETLLMNSFCYDTEWYFDKNNQEEEEYFTTKFKTIQDLTNKSNREIAEDVIKKRILLIYKEWYETLDIGEFFENNKEPQ